MSGCVLKIPRELVDRYSAAVPRYTSYPTAVDWKDDVAAEEYPGLLEAAADVDEPCGVYVHIPFCEERCLFCACNVVITRDHSRADDYIALLEREIETLARTGIGRRPVTQYHWGGGTPTYLGVDQIRRLQDAFKRVFTLAPDAEVAVEVDPRRTSAEQLELLAQEGFNRLSLGIQDFDPKVQKAVRRVQSLQETTDVVEAGRAAGFCSVNVDLIYGLPHQTLAGFTETVRTVLEVIRPERIALFHLAHVPWMRKHHTALDMDVAPDASEKLEIFTRTVEACTANGYEYLGLDHFAVPEDELARARNDRTLQRNFMGYGTRAGHDLIGLGVSSIGEVGGCFVQNERVLNDWRERVQGSGLGVLRGHRLTADDKLRRDVIMKLMCHGCVLKSEIESVHGIRFDDVFAEELQDLAPLESDDLLERTQDAINLTPVGQVFMRNVVVVFDRYFRARKLRGDKNENIFSKTF